VVLHSLDEWIADPSGESEWIVARRSDQHERLVGVSGQWPENEDLRSLAGLSIGKSLAPELLSSKATWPDNAQPAEAALRYPHARIWKSLGSGPRDRSR